jgi:hypothetical protein
MLPFQPQSNLLNRRLRSNYKTGPSQAQPIHNWSLGPLVNDISFTLSVSELNGDGDGVRAASYLVLGHLLGGWNHLSGHAVVKILVQINLS